MELPRPGGIVGDSVPGAVSDQASVESQDCLVIGADPRHLVREAASFKLGASLNNRPNQRNYSVF